MNIEYEKQSDSMYIKFAQGNYFESNEINEGVILDYDQNGKIIGIEILDASRRLSSHIFKDNFLAKAELQRY